MVEDTIDLDELQNHNYVLLPTLDNDLARFRDELVATRDQLDDEHRLVGEDLGIDIEKKLHLENHQVYKYSFRITKAVSRTVLCGDALRPTTHFSGGRPDPEQEAVHRSRNAEVGLDLHHVQAERSERRVPAFAGRVREETAAPGQRSRRDCLWVILCRVMPRSKMLTLT
jgi:hypothetical protein